jgi:tetratricopeptide (TPR) repeat protein
MPLPAPQYAFVGREPELRALAKGLLSSSSPRLASVCALQGVGGVGKSYLVEHFGKIHADPFFPGGLVRLSLESNDPRDDRALFVALSDRLRLRVGEVEPAAIVRERLLRPKMLLHIENVNAASAAMAVNAMVRGLGGCAVAVTGRYPGLGTASGWVKLVLEPFSEPVALEQLEAEGCAARDEVERDAQRRLVRALGGLPLAIHLAAGHLREGRSAAWLMENLRARGLDRELHGSAEPVLDSERSRALVQRSLEVSLERLREELEPDGERLFGAFATLGYAPPGGVGRSLGAAMGGLGESDFDDLIARAARLGLVAVVVMGGQPRIQVHPELGGLLQGKVAEVQVIHRATAWFVERLAALPRGRELEQGSQWREVQAETDALALWLPRVPDEDLVKVESAGSTYAQINGPYAVWMTFGERVLSVVHEDPAARSNVLWTLANVAKESGAVDRAMAFAEEKLAIERQRRDEHGEALALSTIASIKMLRGETDEAILTHLLEVLPRLERTGDIRAIATITGRIAEARGQRGHYDEALQILVNVVLPAFKTLGNVREQAATLKQIADIHQLQGELGEALRIRRDEVLPMLEGVGDIRARAAVLTGIADVLHIQGDPDQALGIYRNEVLPALEQMGDVPGRAALLLGVSDVLQSRGDLDEALRLLQEEALPVFERILDVRGRSHALIRVGDILQKQGKSREALRIYQKEVLPAVDKLNDRALSASLKANMAEAHQTNGEMDEALRLYREAAKLYKTLGSSHQWAVTTGEIGDILHYLGQTDAAMHIYRDREIHDILSRTGDVRSQIGLWVNSTDILQDRGEPEEALRIFQEEILPAVEKLGDARMKAVLRSKSAEVYASLGQTKEALRIYRDEVLPVIEKLGSTREQASARQGIADLLKTQGELDQALQILRDHVVPTFEELGNLPGLAGAIGGVVEILQARGAFDEAVQLCRDRMLPLADKPHDLRGRAAVLCVLTDALRGRGDPSDLEEAKKLLEELLTLCDETGYPHERAGALGALARVYLSFGELDGALRFREDQIAIYDKLADASRRAAATMGLAAVHVAQWDANAARKLLEEQVLPALRRPGDIRSHAAALAQLSAAHLARGALDEALRVTREEELPAMERTGDARGVVAAQHRIGRILLRRAHEGDREAAEGALKVAHDEAERMGLHSARAIHRMRRSLLLESITIHNFKSIERLALSFRHDSQLAGQWTCIAGLNGSGKSAVLQAIALVLLGAHNAPEVGPKWLKGARRRVNGESYDTTIEAQVRIGSERHHVKITIGEEGVDLVGLASTSVYPAMKEVWDEREQNHLLLSYGAGRNLSERLPGDYKTLSDDVQRQMTLFDPLTEVASAEVLVEQRNGSSRLLPMLKRLLTIVLRDTALKVAPDRERLRFLMNGANVSPSDLPDGFRATVAWLGDLCAAWHAKAPDEARDGDPSRIRGIVLVDEIDLHLHPRLQRLLIPRLRQALPDMQWIVSTHSPLVLSSFDQNELIVLDAQSSTGVRELDRQILGFSTDEIYEWLMETEPRSVALKETVDQEQLALLLAQSPDVNEQKAQANQELRRKLVERMQRRDAEKGQS